jgi:hypothetical protein
MKQEAQARRTDMKAVYALYSTPESASRAVDALKTAGLTDAEITVLSSEPLEEYKFAQRDRATWMPWLAVAGAIAGLSVALLLVSFAQRAWPINTGGMPITSGWANMVVLFELTMLGAVLATTATLLASARLPRRLPALYDPAISEGKILIGVERPRNAAAVERALREGGRGVFKTLA